MDIKPEDYLRDKAPRFGKDNPEKMDVPFWKHMIRTGWHAYGARQEFKDSDRMDGPVWTFDRFGISKTKLSNGDVVCVAGEHEDFYDPDFNIYNDVIVLPADGEIEIYGYPREVFPPTDFHSANLAGSVSGLWARSGTSRLR